MVCALDFSDTLPQSLPCVGVAWISSDVLVIGGGASLQLWAGLSQMGQMTVTTQPRLL